MTLLEEGSLIFDFSAALKAYRFDDHETHGANEMKKVDFIVEWESEIWMVEVKNPFKTSDPQEKQKAVERMRKAIAEDSSRFEEWIKSDDYDEMIIGINNNKLHSALGTKARDSFLYLYLTNGTSAKPLKYLVFFADDKLSFQALTTANTRLKEACAFEGKSFKIPHSKKRERKIIPWAMPYLKEVRVLDFYSWQEFYGKEDSDFKVPIRRIPPTPTPPNL
jgi:hypothetical protein